LTHYPGTAAGTAWREVLIMADDVALDEVGRSSYPSDSHPDDPFLDIVWWEN